MYGEWEIHDKPSFKAKERVVRVVWDLYDNTSCRGVFLRNYPVNISLRLQYQLFGLPKEEFNDFKNVQSQKFKV